ncbi:MAG TPA: hypothetical protein VM553_07265, partial [Dongiaceae bacterium]|nr:hypothetical protein [Dongiaceae bacterium]
MLSQNFKEKIPFSGTKTGHFDEPCTIYSSRKSGHYFPTSTPFYFMDQTAMEDFPSPKTRKPTSTSGFHTIATVLSASLLLAACGGGGGGGGNAPRTPTDPSPVDPGTPTPGAYSISGT